MTQITNTRKVTGDITTEATDIKEIIRECYEQLYMYKSDNSDKTDHLPHPLKLPQLIQFVRDHLNSPITIKEIEFIILKFP